MIDQRCHIVYEKECRRENEQKCQTVTETITQQQCQTINEKVCNTINDQQCKTVSETVNEQQCTTVNEQQCRSVMRILYFPHHCTLQLVSCP